MQYANFKAVSQGFDNIQIVIEMNEKVSHESNTLGTHGSSMQCESIKTPRKGDMHTKYRTAGYEKPPTGRVLN